MTVRVILKHPGNLAKKTKAFPLELSGTPATLRELIHACVEVCVSAYFARAEAAQHPAPVGEEAFAAMEELGKFAFGVHYNTNRIDSHQAVETAMQAVEDGLVRVFLEQEELTNPDAPLEIPEGAALTFVRLTMLSGRMW